MMMKRAISIFQVFVFILCVNFLALGQAVCNGDKIFTEKSCAGDEISDAEIKLYQIINQYRKENNLPPVPISKALSVLANRHLLDIVNNLKKTTHAWSNCPYDLNDRKTWDCVSEAPKRLNVGYEGQAFENLYRNFDGNADPVAALGAWKKSDLHNSLILNLSIWKDKNFDAIGVGFNGQYAAIWFGTSNSQVTKSIRPQGLGISYKDILKNLGNVVAMQKVSSVSEQRTWLGVSKDKSISLELIGSENDIANAKVTLKISMAGSQKLSADKRQVVISFIDNIFGQAPQNADWLDENLAKLNGGSSAYRSLIKDDKVIEISKDAQNNLVFVAKPYQKKTVREVL